MEVSMEDQIKEIKQLLIKLDKKTDLVDNKVDVGLSTLAADLKSVDNKFDYLDDKFEHKFEAMGNRIDSLEDNINKKIEALDHKIDHKSEDLYAVISTMTDVIYEDLQVHEKRIIKIEKKLAA